MRKAVEHIKRYSQKGRHLASNTRIKNKLRLGLICVFTILLLVSIIEIVITVLEERQEQEAFSCLAEQVRQAEQTPDNSPTLILSSNTEPEPVNYTEYYLLYEKNNDFVGWLSVDNTKINYPVVFTPDEPEYYLRRAFDKTDSIAGTPFIGESGTIDSDLFIIYGHNMKNDTMFGMLERYKKKSFWQEHPTVQFTTLTEQREYEIFAVLQTRILYQDEEGYRWYYQAGDLTEESFNELIEYTTDNALYDTETIPIYGEQIVILSTCAYHTDNGRLIVVAREKDNCS